MRAIARHLAITASAVHYYFPSRQALLDAPVVDGFTSLAEALRTTYEGAAPRPPGEQWLAVCRAHRAWALDHQAEYLLLYGHDGGCAAPDPFGPLSFDLPVPRVRPSQHGVRSPSEGR